MRPISTWPPCRMTQPSWSSSGANGHEDGKSCLPPPVIVLSRIVCGAPWPLRRRDRDRAVATSQERKARCLGRSVWSRRFRLRRKLADDLPVWRSARQAYVVNAPASIEQRARSLNNIAAVMPSQSPTLRDWMKGLRLHQWLKNLLLFVPLVAAHRYTEPLLVIDALIAFLCFGLCASSVYILNDLLDLRDDRIHAAKAAAVRLRSTVSPVGLIAFPCLLLTRSCLPPGSCRRRSCGACNLLCRDACLLPGAQAPHGPRRDHPGDPVYAAHHRRRRSPGIPLSFWLLAFSMFMFLSLALVKRYAELSGARAGEHANAQVDAATSRTTCT